MKQRKENAYVQKLLAVLTLMDAMNIKTCRALQTQKGVALKKHIAQLPVAEQAQYAGLPEAYYDLPDALAQTMMDFIMFVAFQSKSTYESGRRKDGNAYRMRTLRQEMGVDPEDIRQNVLETIFKNLDKVLDRSPDAQIPYCFEICNHGVVNGGRSYSKISREQSLNAACNTEKAKDDGKVMTMEDTRTSGVSAEDWAIAKVTGSEEILEDLHQLHTPEQAFVYLCMYDCMRPRHIYEQYASLGNASFLVADICKKYGIRGMDLPKQVNRPLSREFTQILHTLDQKAICNKISDIKYTFPAPVKARLKGRMPASNPAAAMKK